MQGRIFALQRTIGEFAIPISSVVGMYFIPMNLHYLITSNNLIPFFLFNIVIAGPLADQCFEPWMKEGGLLSSTIFGQLVGTGPGRGIALLFVILGLSNTLASILGFLYTPLRRVDIDLPDAIPDPKKAK